MKTRVIQIFDSTIANYAVQAEVYAGASQYRWETVYCFEGEEEAINFAKKLAKHTDKPPVIEQFGERDENNRA
jgi:hypothetical protein